VKRNQKNIKKTQTNTCQCPLSTIVVQDPRRQFRRNHEDYGGKDSWKRWVSSL